MRDGHIEEYEERAEASRGRCRNGSQRSLNDMAALVEGCVGRAMV